MISSFSKVTSCYPEQRQRVLSVFSNHFPIILPQSFRSSSEKTSFFRRRPEETQAMPRRNANDTRSKPVKTGQNPSQVYRLWICALALSH
ncbi:hypothetical protein [Epilithonimonas sp.]|uniref:hypothetical protein n=1 Tax=Epilithonimonas sp. TaxID=2894511 RepID=UPI0035AF62EE